MSSFYEKLVKFFNGSKNSTDLNPAKSAENGDMNDMQNLEDLIDVSWAGYMPK